MKKLRIQLIDTCGECHFSYENNGKVFCSCFAEPREIENYDAEMEIPNFCPMPELKNN